MTQLAGFFAFLVILAFAELLVRKSTARMRAEVAALERLTGDALANAGVVAQRRAALAAAAVPRTYRDADATPVLQLVPRHRSIRPATEYHMRHVPKKA